MKKLLKKLKKIDFKIVAKKAEIFNINDSAYYVVFGNEVDRTRDLEEVKHELLDLMNLKHATLDSLSIAMNLEKADLSTYQRTLLLAK